MRITFVEIRHFADRAVMPSRLCYTSFVHYKGEDL